MRVIALLFAALAISACHSNPVLAQTPSASCRVNADTATGIRRRIQQLFLASDPVRLSNIGLSPVDTSTLLVVTSEGVCAQALAAYNSSLLSGSGLPNASSVYVVSAGSARFLVVNPDSAARAGHYLNYFVFDSLWTLLAKVAG
jgi:hypothetical protein